MIAQALRCSPSRCTQRDSWGCGRMCCGTSCALPWDYSLPSAGYRPRAGRGHRDGHVIIQMGFKNPGGPGPPRRSVSRRSSSTQHHALRSSARAVRFYFRSPRGTRPHLARPLTVPPCHARAAASLHVTDPYVRAAALKSHEARARGEPERGVCHARRRFFASCLRARLGAFVPRRPCLLDWVLSRIFRDR